MAEVHPFWEICALLWDLYELGDGEIIARQDEYDDQIAELYEHTFTVSILQVSATVYESKVGVVRFKDIVVSFCNHWKHRNFIYNMGMLHWVTLEVFGLEFYCITVYICILCGYNDVDDGRLDIMYDIGM